MKIGLAPIILFVYNRPWHTEQTLEALMKNELANQSTLYIYSDGPKNDASEEDLKNIKGVRTLIRKKKWCKEVVIMDREQNLGLANNILNGVTQVINQYGKIIVLEDDIRVDSYFLTYMNKALDFFKANKKVFHINGFNNESNLQFLLKDFYFLKFMSCWGWATWKDKWDMLLPSHSDIYARLIGSPEILSKFNYENTLDFHFQLKANIEGEIKSWAILWFSTVFFNNGLCLTPKYSLVENIGMDGSGVHCTESSFHRKIYQNKSHNFNKHFKYIVYNESFLSRWHLKLFYKHGGNLNFTKIVKLKINKLFCF